MLLNKMESNLITSLPSDIQKLAGRYRKENRFLNWFINKYFVGEDNGVETAENIRKFNDLLQLNNLKSKLIIREEKYEDDETGEITKESKMYFRMDYSDIIDINIIKQFIMLSLSILFDDEDIANDLYNEQLGDINNQLRYYEIPLQIVGTFWKYQKKFRPGQFYLVEVRDSIKLDVRV